MTKTVMAEQTQDIEPMQDVDGAADLSSGQCDHSLIATAPDEVDRILLALMQTQYHPSAAQQAGHKVFGGLESLLQSACLDLRPCYSEEFMGGDSMSMYEPVRFLRLPYPCAPPQPFTRRHERKNQRQFPYASIA